jgi:hypothetical protein
MILKLFYPILHYLFQTNSCLLSNIIFEISVLARTGHYMIFINSIYGKKINIYIYINYRKKINIIMVKSSGLYGFIINVRINHKNNNHHNNHNNYK